MIGTLIRLGWTNLKRDRPALLLTFLVPLVFFSIFALIFGNMGGGGDDDGGFEPLKVLAVDEDATAISSSFLAAVAQQDGLEVSLAAPADEGEPEERWTRETAHREVRLGRADAAVVVPSGFAEGFGDFGQGGAPVELIHDASNPFAQYTVAGLLQAAAFQTSPGVLMERGLETLEQFGGGSLTGAQLEALSSVQDLVSLSGGGGGAGGAGGIVAVEATAAHEAAGADDEAEEERRPSMVAYYAAGIGVMFLLFSAVGAAGTLLEDEESGTLERLLSSRVGMGELLRGRWLFYSLLGVAQVVLMFVWGAVAFDLELFTAKRLVGFALMAVATGAAAAAFALLLATACKSRAQLGGVSTIVILVMSALGGSMVPRFVMPGFMDTLALFTFNGWALDGFLKVFWYDDPEAGVVGGVIDLLPQAGVLALGTVVFLWIARRLARRWEAA